MCNLSHKLDLSKPHVSIITDGELFRWRRFERDGAAYVSTEAFLTIFDATAAAGMVARCYDVPFISDTACVNLTRCDIVSGPGTRQTVNEICISLRVEDVISQTDRDELELMIGAMGLHRTLTRHAIAAYTPFQKSSDCYADVLPEWQREDWVGD